MGETTIIEINGVKLDLDLRQAKRVETMRVGDRVSVLHKPYSGWRVAPGVIVGFEPFRNLPSIVVLYVTDGGEITQATYNSESKDLEIVPAIDDRVLLERDRIEEILSRNIERARTALEDAQHKLSLFRRQFNVWFNPATGETAAAPADEDAPR